MCHHLHRDDRIEEEARRLREREERRRRQKEELSKSQKTKPVTEKVRELVKS
ncbi:hypothetical protein [Rubrobacter taiwanensis]|jgi:Zn-finger protein|uniref:hypothetical protein n=1 Tax=Rubrobacter taiwanensis TaxID=185139 RepID=UPI0014045ADD|nr:hypothetical protein [Rubrobacter taiwanensis]